MFFFFKQKTAYEMRISDWSSDVCSSDLIAGCRIGVVDFIVLAHTAVFVIGTDHPSERRACVVGQTQFLIERLDRTIVAIDVQYLEIGAVALLQRLAAVRGRLSLCADQAAAAKWWLSMPMASVSAEGPMPKALSTRRTSPLMPGCRHQGRACPLRRARMTSNPLIVA